LGLLVANRVTIAAITAALFVFVVVSSEIIQATVEAIWRMERRAPEENAALFTAKTSCGLINAFSL
jgi:hypothetical protein